MVVTLSSQPRAVKRNASHTLTRANMMKLGKGMVKDFELVLRELGIDYYLSGDEAIAKCPAHDDRHPSWSMNVGTGVHHCFSCGFSGSIASLAAHVLNLTYPEAVLWCNARVGWAFAHQWREAIDNVSFSPAYMKIGEADTALFTQPPDDELAGRGISREAADAFGILWNPGKQEWIFPVRDPNTNQLWGWQSKNARTFRHYPAGIRRSETLFGLGAFHYGSPVVLIESPIDAAYIYSAGRRGGLSSFGVQVSSQQFAIIHRLTEHLILALDRDSAGVEQTARICDEFNQVKIRVFNYAGIHVKDPGEMSYEEVRYGIDNAIPALKWMRMYKHGEIEIYNKRRG